MTIVRSRNLLAGCVATALIVSAGLVFAQTDGSEAIEARLAQYEEFYNAGDAEALARLFSENVIYFGPLGQVSHGRQAVEERYRSSFEMGFSDMEIETLEVRVMGDTAYDIARYSVVSPEGMPLSGYHLAILEKENGEWIVHRTLVNAIMPDS